MFPSFCIRRICILTVYPFALPFGKGKENFSFRVLRALHHLTAYAVRFELQLTMNQDATSPAPDFKQEENETTNVKVRESFGSKGGWDGDVTLNTDIARLVLGR